MWTVNLIGKARKNCKKAPKDIQEKKLLEPMKKPNTTDYVNLSFRISAKQADKAKKALISIGAEERKKANWKSNG
jgi:hypothetical protein